MKKQKRKDIVLAILRVVETRPSKNVYGYFTRKQLVELHTSLLSQKEDLKEIYTNGRTIQKLLTQNKTLSFETNTLLTNILRLSMTKGN